MKTIPLTRGKIAVVDDSDWEWLKEYKWYCGKTKKGKLYARAKINGKEVSMHRLIMDAPKGVTVDHVSGITLDNRRSNLRLCSQADNNRNAVKHNFNTSSMYKGVRKHACGKWHSRIQVNDKTISLGLFDSEIEAAEAYNNAAKEYFGEFAQLNKIVA